MGRTLQNTMINLGLQNACDEAVYQVSTALRAGGTRVTPGLMKGFVCLFAFLSSHPSAPCMAVTAQWELLHNSRSSFQANDIQREGDLSVGLF